MYKKDLLIAKLEELIRYIQSDIDYNSCSICESLESEIAALKSEVESEKEINVNEFCECNYKRPHIYGGSGKKLCLNCQKWIKS